MLCYSFSLSLAFLFKWCSHQYKVVNHQNANGGHQGHCSRYLGSHGITG